ncbi:MAG: YtxH domain-containing protein [Patescibacteria group bacterium]
MHDRQEQNGSSFNTFLFGILIGVLATLLFTTKKGRRLLKVITDESVDRLSKWEDMVKTMQEHIDEDVEDESVMGEEVPKIAPPSHTEKIEIDDEEPTSEMPDVDELPHIKIDKLETSLRSKSSEGQEEEKVEEASVKKPRRLFKGIRKKSA